MKGRKPKPTALVELHGRHTSHGRKPRPDEPKPVGDLFSPPDWMTAEQKDSWSYALKHSPPGLLKMVDRGILTGWVIAEDLHRQACKLMAKSTILVRPATGPQGSWIGNPLIGTINREFALMLKAAGELGFSPVSRPRIEMGSFGTPAVAERPASRVAGDGTVVPLRDYLRTAPR